MSDATTETGATPAAGTPDSDIAYFATKPNDYLDEVMLQADYTARATLSFWRFRQLGGGPGEYERYTGKDGKPAKRPKRPSVGGLTTKGVHYVSDHPKVRIFSLSMIALLVLFESAANAYFFAQQSDFGISGGIFQAAAVSLANVATSYFIIGFWGLRHITLPSSSRWPLSWNRRDFIRIAGACALVIGVILVLLVNLSAAHYRNLLDLRAEGLMENPEFFQDLPTRTFPHFLIDAEVCRTVLTSDIGKSIGSAATNAMCRPFSLHSLDAMVLFALGVSISALAAFEGRKSDSAFPGFSDAARQLEGARRDLQDALADYYDAYPDFVYEAASVLGTPVLKADGSPELDEDDEPVKELSPQQEVQLMRLLDKQVEPYRKLLTSDPDLMRDEFAVPMDAVERVLGRRGTIEDQDEAGDGEGKA